MVTIICGFSPPDLRGSAAAASPSTSPNPGAPRVAGGRRSGPSSADGAGAGAGVDQGDQQGAGDLVQLPTDPDPAGVGGGQPQLVPGGGGQLTAQDGAA